MEFFTIPDEGWSLLGDKPKDPEPSDDRIKLRRLLDKPALWDQYCNERIYTFDKAIRKWIEEMSKSSSWYASKNKRRYTYKMIFERVFGVPLNEADDKYHMIGQRICAYYSTRIQASGSIDGKKYNKNIYTISPRRMKNKPPYSLKLRIELMEKDGIVPNYRSMRLPKDDLKPGHARNKRTDENMRKRRDEARRRYNERVYGTEYGDNSSK